MADVGLGARAISRTPHNQALEGPGAKCVFASYADELRTKHSLDRRKMLQSQWYRERWPKGCLLCRIEWGSYARSRRDCNYVELMTAVLACPV